MPLIQHYELVRCGAVIIVGQAIVACNYFSQHYISFLSIAYYFPTARKRYLPRIQKVSDQLKQVLPKAFANKNQNSNWLDDVQSLYTTADNAILPMKLYTSSLDGQGLRMTQSEFVKTMKVNIDKYERNVQQLSKALDQQDKTMAQTAVQQLSQALADFRSAGKLSEDIEDLPSVDEVRRMTMRRPTMKFTQY
jgi:GTP-dependent phosphoenolpyruvate carboxykinase